MTDLADQRDAHVALCATADDIVAQFVSKMTELAASEAALRGACVSAYPGSATFAKDGQTGIHAYMQVLSERLFHGDDRPIAIKPVGELAAAGWEGIA